MNIDRPSIQIAKAHIRLRFSIRFLLVAIAVVSLWLGVTVHRARTRKFAVAKLTEAGAMVTYDYQETAPRTFSTSGKPSGPQWLRNTLGAEYFDVPVRLSLYQPPSDDRWIDALNDLGSMRTMVFSGRFLTDHVLRQLAGQNSLIEMHLTDTSVTSNGLKELAKFPRIRWLVINVTNIADDGVANLSSLSQLEELNASNTKLTDAAIPLLAQLKNLRRLDVRETQISAEGAAQLARLLPNCHVQFGH